MKTTSSQGMRDLERRAVQEFGISTLTLMENAGRGTAELILDLAEDSGHGTKNKNNFPTSLVLSPLRRVIVTCGKGNNGGDGEGFLSPRTSPCRFNENRPATARASLALAHHRAGLMKTGRRWIRDCAVFNRSREKSHCVFALCG